MADYTGKHMGNYRLSRLLGQGGFAEVYLGEHIHLGTQAAIKVLHAPLVGAKEVEKFRREARTIATLAHPHIVRVLEFGIEEGLPYLVLDYAPGGTLRRRHPPGAPVPPATVLPYVQQVAQALQYAHDRQIIHRDIKPQNLLIGRENEILLGDFGISTVAESTSRQQTEEFAGTALYAAPEQMQGHAQPASDQYALGVVVYEWLTGAPPFHGAVLEIMWKHVQSQPPPLRERVPTLAPQIEQVVLTALAKNPSQRFARVQDFALAFEHACKEGSMFSTASNAFATTPVYAGTPLTPSVPSFPAGTGMPQPQSVPQEKTGDTGQRHPGTHRLAKLWARALVVVASCVEASIIALLLGLRALPFPAALQAALLQHPGGSLVLGGILLASSLIAVLFWQRPGEPLDTTGTQHHLPRRLLISNLLATASTLLFVTLLLLVLIRPAWCPTALCPTTTTPSTASVIPGVHDDNLEVTLTAIQSSYYVIPGNPAQYSLSHLPTSIAAQRIDIQNFPAYRVVVGIHSLQHGRFGLLIHTVYLVVVQASPVSTPLNVWSEVASEYTLHPYQILYKGEAAGVIIPSPLASAPQVQLVPGESDNLDIQVSSQAAMDVRFQVQVEYRVANESAFHRLTLPNTFEAVFTTASNWHLYQLQNGHFVPGS